MKITWLKPLWDRLYLARIIVRIGAALGVGASVLVLLMMLLAPLAPYEGEAALMSGIYPGECSESLPIECNIFVLDIGRRLMTPITNDPGNERYPAYSPDGRQIAYHATGNDDVYDLYVMDYDGEDAGLFGIADERPEYDEAMVSWSPDGRQIVFHAGVSYRNGLAGTDFYLYVADVETGAYERVSDIAGDWLYGDWSPDGERLIFTTNALQSAAVSPAVQSGNYSAFDLLTLYVMDADSDNSIDDVQGQSDAEVTSQPPISTPMEGTSPDFPPTAVPTNPSSGTSSPPNIIFITPPPNGTPMVIPPSVINPQNNPNNPNTTQLLPPQPRDLEFGRAVPITSLGERVLFPAWSLDGEQIAYVISPNGSQSDLYVINADGTNRRRLTNTPTANNTHPEWLPDGRILFASDRDGDYDLYVINADGSGLEQLTYTDRDEQAPDFRPVGG